MLPPQLSLRTRLLFTRQEGIALQFFEFLAGDVTSDFGEAGQISAFIPRSPDGAGDPDSSAVPPDMPTLVFGCVAGRRLAEFLARLVRRLVLGREQHFERLTYYLRRRISENLLSATAPLQDYAV